MYYPCPSLFRNGRLKPIKFDYFEIAVIDQLTSHYFGREISKDIELPQDLQVKMGWFIEMIVTCSDYEIFKSMLAEKLKNDKSAKIN